MYGHIQIICFSYFAGKYVAWIVACFGVSSVVGPIVGGAFTTALSWRWNFYISKQLHTDAR